MRNTDDKKLKEIIKKIQNGFPVDVLFNNYDVVGGYINNILIDNNNNICRIDNDTSFFYNAKVGSKMELIFEKRNFIYDVWTLRSQNTPNKLEYYNKYCINTNFSV